MQDSAAKDGQKPWKRTGPCDRCCMVRGLCSDVSHIMEKRLGPILCYTCCYLQGHCAGASHSSIEATSCSTRFFDGYDAGGRMVSRLDGEGAALLCGPRWHSFYNAEVV